MCATLDIVTVAIVQGEIVTNAIETLKVIRWRLAVLMADREVSSSELAKKTGFTLSTIGKHKNKRLMPSRLEYETLLKYCDALNCQPGDLLVCVPRPVGEITK